jgi:Transcription initiation factor IID, 18kD subunit
MTQTTELAVLRGSKSITTDDLLFLVRKSKEKVFRLKEFLSWKELRKNVKSSTAASSSTPSEQPGDLPDDMGIAANRVRHSYLVFIFLSGLEMLPAIEENNNVTLDLDDDLDEHRLELYERLEVRIYFFIHSIPL